jgi:hypothetical protein
MSLASVVVMLSFTEDDDFSLGVADPFQFYSIDAMQVTTNAEIHPAWTRRGRRGSR